MPPGGHIDEDETPEDAAKRECKEETGLDVEIIGGEHPNLFKGNPQEGNMLKKPIALLLENIPASEEPFDPAQGRRGEPAHQHMDFLYIARPINESQVLFPEEKDQEIRWFTLHEIKALNEKKEIFANVKTYILSLLSEPLQNVSP